MSLSNMTVEERNVKIFEASIACSGAAVEFLRSVNRPLNATYIAQTAWEIAKKLEEMMEASYKKECDAAAAGVKREVVAPGNPVPPTSNPANETVPFNEPAVAGAR